MIVTARDHAVRPSAQPGNCHNLDRHYDASNDKSFAPAVRLQKRIDRLTFRL
jgi:hypothetical protein